MLVIFLLVFAVVLGGIAIGASKASKAAKKAKYKQDIELIREVMQENKENR